MNEPTHLDLFSGIGGFCLSAQWAGFRTIAFVERDAYCQKVLAKHWPRVPCYSDICQFGGRSLGPISLLTGGFPCQPFSVAGQQRGKEDERYLWPEMLRVIQATNPNWIIGENVAGLDGLGLDDCISDLEASGYEVAPPIEIPACAIDARHVRNRIWILANSHSFSSRESYPPERNANQHRPRRDARRIEKAIRGDAAKRNPYCQKAMNTNSPNENQARQWVVCAAIRSSKGKIVAGARHYDSVMRPIAFENNERKGEWVHCEHGFIDQFGKFLTREEAWTIALSNNQIKDPNIYSKGTLYSEDLY